MQCNAFADNPLKNNFARCENSATVEARFPDHGIGFYCGDHEGRAVTNGAFTGPIAERVVDFEHTDACEDRERPDECLQCYQSQPRDDDDGYDIDTDPYMRGDYIAFDGIDVFGNDPFA